MYGLRQSSQLILLLLICRFWLCKTAYAKQWYFTKALSWTLPTRSKYCTSKHFLCSCTQDLWLGSIGGDLINFFFWCSFSLFLFIICSLPKWCLWNGNILKSNCYARRHHWMLNLSSYLQTLLHLHSNLHACLTTLPRICSHEALLFSHSLTPEALQYLEAIGR